MTSVERTLLRAAEQHLWALEQLVKPETRLTLIIRLPGDEEAESVITRDELGEVIKVLERRRQAGATATDPPREVVEGRHLCVTGEMRQGATCDVCKPPRRGANPDLSTPEKLSAEMDRLEAECRALGVVPFKERIAPLRELAERWHGYSLSGAYPELRVAFGRCADDLTAALDAIEKGGA